MSRSSNPYSETAYLVTKLQSSLHLLSHCSPRQQLLLKVLIFLGLRYPDRTREATMQAKWPKLSQRPIDPWAHSPDNTDLLSAAEDLGAALLIVLKSERKGKQEQKETQTHLKQSAASMEHEVSLEQQTRIYLASFAKIQEIPSPGSGGLQDFDYDEEAYDNACKEPGKAERLAGMRLVSCAARVLENGELNHTSPTRVRKVGSCMGSEVLANSEDSPQVVSSGENTAREVVPNKEVKGLKRSKALLDSDEDEENSRVFSDRGELPATPPTSPPTSQDYSNKKRKIDRSSPTPAGSRDPRKHILIRPRQLIGASIIDRSAPKTSERLPQSPISTFRKAIISAGIRAKDKTVKSNTRRWRSKLPRKERVIDEVEAQLEEEDAWLDSLDYKWEEELSDEGDEGQKDAGMPSIASWTPINALI